MVAHAALAIVAAVALIGGGAAAAGAGLFNTPGTVTLNLGNLSPGNSGTAQATTTVTLANSSEYKIQRTMEDRIGSVFSTLQILLTVNGHTFNLTGAQGEPHIYLNNGTYDVQLSVSYTVRGEAHSANETRVPFIFLQQVKNESEIPDQNLYASNSTSGDNGNQSASPGALVTSSYDDSSLEKNDTNSSRMALFALSFVVVGNAGVPNEHGTGDSKKTEDQIFA